MAGANVAPSSGVSGGMGAVLRGYREEKARQFGNSAGGGGGSGDLDVARLNWGQRRWLMKNQEALDARRDSQRQAANEDLRYATVLEDTMATRDTSRAITQDKAAQQAAGSRERSLKRTEGKIAEAKSQADFGRQQQTDTSQRIYEESTKDTAFAREQKGLNAAARREKASRNQAFSMGGGAPAESVTFGKPGTGGKGGGGGDTIKFSVT